MFLEGQIKQALILGTLLLILAVIALRKTIFSGNEAIIAPANQDGVMQVKDSPTLASVMQWQPPEPISINFRDPMTLKMTGSGTSRPSSRPIRIMTQHEGSKGDLVQIEGATFYLKGILYSEENPSSIITDTALLHEGDTIHGIEVVKISPRSVEFRKGDHRYNVRVGEKSSDQ